MKVEAEGQTSAAGNLACWRCVTLRNCLSFSIESMAMVYLGMGCNFLNTVAQWSFRHFLVAKTRASGRLVWHVISRTGWDVRCPEAHCMWVDACLETTKSLNGFQDNTSESHLEVWKGYSKIQLKTYVEIIFWLLWKLCQALKVLFLFSSPSSFSFLFHLNYMLTVSFLRNKER